MEEVTHYFPRAGIAVVILDDCIATGKTIRIRKSHDDFCRNVNSMEVVYHRISKAEKGKDIGIKVIRRVHEGDLVCRETPNTYRETGMIPAPAPGGLLVLRDETGHVSAAKTFF